MRIVNLQPGDETLTTADRTLYVDDLVTADDRRSEGFGRALHSHLFERAGAEGCRAFELDSRVDRVPTRTAGISCSSSSTGESQILAWLSSSLTKLAHQAKKTASGLPAKPASAIRPTAALASAGSEDRRPSATWLHAASL